MQCSLIRKPGWHLYCVENSPGSFDECRLSTRVADIGCYHPHAPSPFIITTPKSDTRFTVSQRIDGSVHLSTTAKMCSRCPRLCMAVAVVINTTAHDVLWTWVLTQCSEACYWVGIALHVTVSHCNLCVVHLCTVFVVDATSGSRQDVHAPAANLTQLKKTAALREKMDVMREKRRVNDMLGCVLNVFF